MPWIVLRRLLAKRLGCSVFELEQQRHDNPDDIGREIHALEIEARTSA